MQLFAIKVQEQVHHVWAIHLTQLRRPMGSWRLSTSLHVMSREHADCQRREDSVLTQINFCATLLENAGDSLIACSSLSKVFVVPLHNGSHIGGAAYQKSLSAVVGFKLGKGPLCH